MVPRLDKVILAAGVAVAAILVVLLVTLGHNSCQEERVKTAKAAAAEAKGEAKGAAAAGETAGQQADEAGSRAADAGEAVRIAKEGLQKLRKPRPATQVLPTPETGQEAPVLPSLPALADPRDAVISQQEVVILALDTQVAELKSQALLLSLSRDQYKAAYHSEQQARIQTELALKAQEGLAKGNLLKGRLQGFLAGVGVGATGVAIAR